MSKHDGRTEVEAGGVVHAVEPARVRRLWHLLEPLHAVLYYAPEVFEEAAALGYETKERWPSYFPLRAAPLGPVGAEQVADVLPDFEHDFVDVGGRVNAVGHQLQLLLQFELAADFR